MPRPRSTLFPYTTLFRSRMPEVVSAPRQAISDAGVTLWSAALAADHQPNELRMRSEERFSRNAETEIYTLSLHDALPISHARSRERAAPGHLRCRCDAVERSACGGSPTQRAAHEIGRAVQQECRDRDLHSFPTRRSSDLACPKS